MPSIRDRIQSNVDVESFVPTDKSAPSYNSKDSGVGPNPYIRCPIPPLNVNTDTLRQFDESGKIPARRVLPLPIATVAGGGTVINNTGVIPAASGGGGGGVPSTGTTLIAQSVSLNIPALPANTSRAVFMTIAKAFQLISITSSQPVEVRMYGTALSQSGDISRLTDSAPAFETYAGIITDVVLDTPPYQWGWQNRIAANTESPQSSNIYITVINPQNVGIAASVITILYLPLET